LSGIAGNYFFPGSSRFARAEASLAADGQLVIVDDSGSELARAPVKWIRVSPRLGKLKRSLTFPDGARFETGDNDGIDALLRGAGHVRRGTFIHRIEGSYRWVAASVVAAAVTVTLFILYGIPAMALWLADETPPYVATVMSNETLNEMQRLLPPTKLPKVDQKRSLALFARVAAQGKSGVKGYRLLFRDGGIIGANAFSLPDGTVVMTDQLYRLSRKDDELEGVFGHEMAHADRHHALQAVYQASLVPAAIALITGDVTQLGHMATLLPGILLQSAYSRGLEQQADDDSAATMKRIGANPAALGELLERMEKKECGKDRCGPSWLGDHPATAERAARLRAESGTKPNH
jgi:Zn-dependent protease with chaperone function